MSRRILFIAPHRSGRNPSQRFRFEQYLPFLEANGWDITYSHLLDEKGDQIFYTNGNYLAKAGVALGGMLTRWKDVNRSSAYDIIFIHREAIMLGTTWFERKIANSSAHVIYDFDDAIWVKDVSEANQKLAFLKKPEKTNEILGLSDLVFAGNEYLASHARQYAKDVMVVPTTIDTNYHLPLAEKQDGPVCIGWTGSKTTVKHLEDLIPVLSRIRSKYGDKVCFRIIADKEREFPELGCSSIAWNASKEIEQLQAIDIGVMPLPDDQWAKGKCGFKALQYLSVGAAAVVSPVGVNTKVVKDGVHGFHASNEAEWESALSKLIEEPGTRKKMSITGREWIISDWSVEAWKSTYLRVFESLALPKRLQL
ncbi:MAG: glycosyltransferase involved in cell wall biosynthesis [Limisphaerales bacterium]